MRMWMVPPKYLCRQHLLGEHKELHMLSGCVERGKSLQGYIDKGLVDLSQLETRHAELVLEMKARGYEHHSRFFPIDATGGAVDAQRNLRELEKRCPRCANRIHGWCEVGASLLDKGMAWDVPRLLNSHISNCAKCYFAPRLGGNVTQQICYRCLGAISRQPRIVKHAVTDRCVFCKYIRVGVIAEAPPCKP